MTFTGGSWRFSYSVSHEELMAGTALLARYMESRRKPRRRLMKALLTASLLFVPFLTFIAMTYVDDFLRWLSSQWRTSLSDGVMPSLAAVAAAVLLLLLMIRPRGAALSQSVIRQAAHDIYHVKATSDATALRARADGIDVELDVRGLEDIVAQDGWIFIIHAGGPILMPLSIFPDDETAGRYILFIRKLIRRRWTNPFKGAGPRP